MTDDEALLEIIVDLHAPVDHKYFRTSQTICSTCTGIWPCRTLIAFANYFQGKYPQHGILMIPKELRVTNVG